MATTSKQWPDGEGSLSISYTGSGNGTISFSSALNEGCDRTLTVTASNSYGNSVAMTVKQLGLREPFLCADGNFLCSDGGTFNVLKQ